MRIYFRHKKINENSNYSAKINNNSTKTLVVPTQKIIFGPNSIIHYHDETA